MLEVKQSCCASEQWWSRRICDFVEAVVHCRCASDSSSVDFEKSASQRTNVFEIVDVGR